MIEGELKTYIDVSGQDNTKNDNGQIISYAIEFVDDDIDHMIPFSV